MTTEESFKKVLAECRAMFEMKMHDYGTSWRVLRPSSITDQIFIKANRIRSIETTGVNKVGEDIRSEFVAVVNYGIIGLIQLKLGVAETDDLAVDRAVELYDKYATAPHSVFFIMCVSPVICKE